MTQAKFIVPARGTARVIIKTASTDELPTFELDWVMDKSDAQKVMAYAIQLQGSRDIKEDK